MVLARGSFETQNGFTASGFTLHSWWFYSAWWFNTAQLVVLQRPVVLRHASRGGLIPCRRNTALKFGRVFCIERQKPRDAGRSGNSGRHNAGPGAAGKHVALIPAPAPLSFAEKVTWVSAPEEDWISLATAEGAEVVARFVVS